MEASLQSERAVNGQGSTSLIITRQIRTWNPILPSESVTILGVVEPDNKNCNVRMSKKCYASINKPKI